MAAFQAEEYKKKLATATSIDKCEKVPLHHCAEGGRYVFISYSHRDYKQVYADLADLYDAGVPFWYDRGLPAGRNWDDVVREKMTDPKCGGVIFYLSENLFLSQSIQTEIHIACGEDGPDKMPWRKVSYFSVNLTSLAPTGILRKVFASKQFVGVDDEPEALRQWMSTLTKAFPDKATYLPYSAPAHKMDMVEQINLCFSIKSNRNPYDFSGAKFVSGTATIEFENGSRYEGEFRDGRFDGTGKLTTKEGYVYDGAWQKGERHGFGIATIPSGASYSGDWKCDAMHGIGKMVFNSQSFYEGDWENGTYHGKGKFSFDDGTYYEGEWNHGVLTGEGKMTYVTGSIYEGEWRNWTFHGMGTLIFSDGAVYEGNWVNGERHGYGKMTLPDGTVYEGNWQNEQNHGLGRLVTADGHIYHGSWENGQYHGAGQLTWPDGSTYAGTWDNGKRQGNGILTLPDGFRYNGAWKNDRMWGIGTVTLSDGTVLKCLFENGELVETLQN